MFILYFYIHLYSSEKLIYNMAVTSFTNSLNQRETLQDFGHEDVNELKYDVRLKMEDSKLENQDSDLKVKVYLQKLAKVKKIMKAEKVIECPTCGKICSSKLSLRNHFRMHLRVDCPHCGKSLSKCSNFQLHQRRCTKVLSSRFQCTICNKKFYAKQDLQRHYKRCQREPDVQKCHICDFGTSSKREFRTHLKTHTRKYSRTQVYQCQLCDFQSVGNKTIFEKHARVHKLKSHKKSIEQTKFICEQCDYKTKRRFDLKVHILRIHDKPKPKSTKTQPKCSFCDYTSSNQWTVTRHEEKCSFSGPEILCLF